jgi:hypothetical protein
MKFLDLLIIIAKKKLVLFGIPLLLSVLTFVIVSFLPKYYYTEIRLRVDDPNSTNISLLDGINKNLFNYFGKPQVNESSDLFIELLAGRENLVSAIHKFRLDTLYKKKAIDLTIKSFLKDFNAGIDDNGILYCGYTGKNIDLCVNLITFMVQNANQKYSRLQKERITLNSYFLTQKYNQLFDSLECYNSELIDFYKENKIINLEKQIELSLLALSNYEQQYKALQVEKRFIELTGSKNSPESKKIEEKIKILKKEFQSLRGKEKTDFQPARNSLFLNTDWGMEQLFFEKILLSKIDIVKEFISAISKEIAFTESKLSRDIPVSQIIQEAYIPDWKVKPKRVVWMLTIFASSFMLCLCYVLFNAYMSGEIAGDEEKKKKISILLSALKP